MDGIGALGGVTAGLVGDFELHYALFSGSWFLTYQHWNHSYNTKSNIRALITPVLPTIDRVSSLIHRPTSELFGILYIYTVYRISHHAGICGTPLPV